MLKNPHLEELHCGSALNCAVGDSCLISEIVDTLDWDECLTNGEHRRQVSRVGGGDDQRENPPGPSKQSRGHRPRTEIATALEHRACHVPESGDFESGK